MPPSNLRRTRASLCCLFLPGLCMTIAVCANPAWVEAKAVDPAPRVLLERAKQLEAAKQFEAALAVYRSLLARQPENDEVRAAMARLFSWQGQYDEAVTLYQEVLSRHPLDHENRIGLARVLSWQKKFVDARTQYEQVLRDEPQQVEAITGLADVLLWSGHADLALSYYERALSITNEAGLAARVRALKADVEAANRPNSSSSPVPEPTPLVQPSNQREAVRLFEQGRRLEADARYADAAVAYRAALGLQQDNDDIRAALARVLSWQGATEEATVLYREVLARHPDDQDTRVALARVLSWQKQFSEARTLYDQALRATPNRIDARRGLAEVAHWEGNRSDALARYEALLADTHDPDIERQLRAVQSELLVSPRAAVGQGLTGLRIPYRDYAKLGYGHYSYTRDQPNERDVLFEVAKPIGDQTLVVRVEPLNRFGRHDTPVSAEFYTPLWQRAWGYVAAQGTVDPHFAPNYSFVGEVAQGLGGLHSVLAPFEVSFGYRRLNYKKDDIDLLMPGLTIFLPFNLWLTEKLYAISNTGAVTLASQLTWRPTDRVQVFTSGSFGTSGERIVATQDFARIGSRTIQGGVMVPINERFSSEASGYYEDRGSLYVRRGGNISLIYHW